ncbi:hypothetical protein ABPG77_001112, partial [Micractinium sp. CCAP 211/92]
MAAMDRSQKIVQVHQYNQEHPEKAVTVVEGPVPEPGQGQVLVRIQLRPVNPADLFSVQGVYPGFKPEKLPAVPGLDGMGVVEQNGPGASRFKPGQRVVATPFDTLTGQGTWQQYVVVPEEKLMAVPESLSDETASQFLVNPVWTGACRVRWHSITRGKNTRCVLVRQRACCCAAAWQQPGRAVTVAHQQMHVKVCSLCPEACKVPPLLAWQVPEGEWLLSNAASSTLGRMVIQLAKHYGVKTINVVRSGHHVEDLKKLGADEVIVSTEEDLVGRVKDITGGKGAYAALECVGGDVTQKILQCTRDGGTVFVYGAMASFELKACIPDLLFRDVTLKGFWLTTYLKS